MNKKQSLWLKKKKQFAGQKPGDALVKWLNDPNINPKFVEDLLADAQTVFRWTAEYGSVRELNVARKQKKLPPAFWDSHQRLNQTLATFTHAPHIDLHEFPDGERVSWMLVTDDFPVAILGVQIRWVLQLIDRGAILKICRCKQCTKWFFAGFSHKAFCTDSCRIEHLTTSEKFKEKRRKYMSNYNSLQKSRNVK